MWCSSCCFSGVCPRNYMRWQYCLRLILHYFVYQLYYFVTKVVPIGSGLRSWKNSSSINPKSKYVSSVVQDETKKCMPILLEWSEYSASINAKPNRRCGYLWQKEFYLQIHSDITSDSESDQNVALADGSGLFQSSVLNFWCTALNIPATSARLSSRMHFLRGCWSKSDRHSQLPGWNGSGSEGNNQ